LQIKIVSRVPIFPALQLKFELKLQLTQLQLQPRTHNTNVQYVV